MSQNSNALTYPKELRYTKEHEWAKKEGNTITVGVTSFAVDQLGDVTLVDLPKVGTVVTLDKRFGDIESVKTVSELFAPVSGTITEVNTALVDAPELVNEEPYGKGWMVKIELSNSAEWDALLNSDAYSTLAG